MGEQTIGEWIAQQHGMPQANADIVDGYFDGREDDRTEYPEASNRSAFYRHGWLNGRDDRIGKPRASAAEIRASLDALFAATPPSPEGASNG
jgi:hypothetical protein